MPNASTSTPPRGVDAGRRFIDGLVRISVGLEHPDYDLSDLTAALAT